MQRTPLLRCRIARVFLGLMFVVVVTSRVRADKRDTDISFEQRSQAAKAALNTRMEARSAAGWTPKSKDEQMVTRLEAMRRMWERKQDRAATRAVFEASRAEVYLTLARDYIKYGSYRRYGYRRTYVQDRVTGIARPVYSVDDYVVMDPLAARLSVYYGNKAARSKGIAAAQEFHANTVYDRRIRNSESRIAALQQKVQFDKQMVKQVAAKRP